MASWFKRGVLSLRLRLGGVDPVGGFTALLTIFSFLLPWWSLKGTYDGLSVHWDVYLLWMSYSLPFEARPLVGYDDFVRALGLMLSSSLMLAMVGSFKKGWVNVGLSIVSGFLNIFVVVNFMGLWARALLMYKEFAIPPHGLWLAYYNERYINCSCMWGLGLGLAGASGALMLIKAFAMALVSLIEELVRGVPYLYRKPLK